MPAGYNQLANVWRYTYPTDDDIGGSVPSGTIIHKSLLVRIEPLKPTTALLEQGLETVKLYQTSASYIALDIKENDELEVVEPAESWYINQHFRVISVQHPSLRPNDPRSQVQLIMRRRDEAHARQL